MNKFIIAAIFMTSTVMVVQAADTYSIPRPRPEAIQLEEMYSSPFEFYTGIGTKYSVRGKDAFQVITQGVKRNNFSASIEYGYAEFRNQYLSGGLGYDFLLSDRFTATPSVRGGYNWNKGAFVAPGIGFDYKIANNLSINPQYEYVKYRKGDDHLFGLTLKVNY